ncbi:MAG: hypothetical protein AAF752_07020 [Bacteroidota bacterium]
MNIDPGLHVKQGINHLNKALQYAARMGDDTVWLTQEDWHVLADTLFHMGTPKEVLPEQVVSTELISDRIIGIKTTTGSLRIERM